MQRDGWRRDLHNLYRIQKMLLVQFRNTPYATKYQSMIIETGYSHHMIDYSQRDIVQN